MIKKYILLMLFISVVFSCSSCQSMQLGTSDFDESKLQRAIDHVLEGNYTEESTTKMKLSLFFELAMNSEDIYSESYYEVDKNDIYFVEKQSSSKKTRYTHFDENYEYIYTCYDDKNWNKRKKEFDGEYNLSLLQYLKYLDMDISGLFTYFAGTYYGNCEKITEIFLESDFEEYISDEEKDILGFEITQYNITVIDGEITGFNFSYQYQVSYELSFLKIKFSYNAKIKNVGTTVVTIPTNLPE